MSGFYAGPYSEAFAHAEAYLAKGRSKTERPVANNTRLRRIDADTIALVYHYTAVVTYHRDGTFTIYGGGWNTVTTKDRIRSYSPAHPHSDGNGGWIVGWTGELTPPRVQKCRTCKGCGVWADAEQCYGPGWDYSNFSCRRLEHCQHGQTESHPTGVTLQGRCYRCDGTGRTDYGSKRIPITTDASTPYRVDADGKYLGATALPETKGSAYPPVKHKAPIPGPSIAHTMGSETADALARVMPGLESLVAHPAKAGEMLTVRQAIISLNDTHRWTRERIADWLDTLDADLTFSAAG